MSTFTPDTLFSDLNSTVGESSSAEPINQTWIKLTIGIATVWPSNDGPGPVRWADCRGKNDVILFIDHSEPLYQSVERLRKLISACEIAVQQPDGIFGYLSPNRYFQTKFHSVGWSSMHETGHLVTLDAVVAELRLLPPTNQLVQAKLFNPRGRDNVLYTVFTPKDYFGFKYVFFNLSFLNKPITLFIAPGHGSIFGDFFSVWGFGLWLWSFVMLP